MIGFAAILAVFAFYSVAWGSDWMYPDGSLTESGTLVTGMSKSGVAIAAVSSSSVNTVMHFDAAGEGTTGGMFRLFCNNDLIGAVKVFTAQTQGIPGTEQEISYPCTGYSVRFVSTILASTSWTVVYYPGQISTAPSTASVSLETDQLNDRVESIGMTWLVITFLIAAIWSWSVLRR